MPRPLDQQPHLEALLALMVGLPFPTYLPDEQPTDLDTGLPMPGRYLTLAMEQRAIDTFDLRKCGSTGRVAWTVEVAAVGNSYGECYRVQSRAQERLRFARLTVDGVLTTPIQPSAPDRPERTRTGSWLALDSYDYSH